ncbi:hypothetical protein IAI10_21230 [Clostridium sp. 19966]|nr:hypothetical protein [Clostridium sp. 19966]MDT8719178.1 hypothetical protein [Clostridium sp. 19966]
MDNRIERLREYIDNILLNMEDVLQAKYTDNKFTIVDVISTSLRYH